MKMIIYHASLEHGSFRLLSTKIHSADSHGLGRTQTEHALEIPGLTQRPVCRMTRCQIAEIQ